MVARIEDFKGIVVGYDVVPRESVVPWDANPRDNDNAVPDVMASIERFGFVDPLVVRKSDMLLCGGHTRLKAATILGIERVPCIFIQCDDPTFKALAIVLNRSAEVATWQEDALGQLLRELDDEGVDMTALGWTPGELEDYLGDSSSDALDFLTNEGVGNGEPGDESPDALSRLDPGDEGDEPETQAKPKVTHKIVFPDETAYAEFTLLMKRVKVAYPGYKTNAERLLAVMRDGLEGL